MLTKGYAALKAGDKLAPFSFERRELRDNDVAMEVLYCGVCHSDLHQARNDWGFGLFPIPKPVTWSLSAVWSTPVRSVTSVVTAKSSTAAKV
jgi:NADPH:quinone reductase-like Zn-dependent oxidoreductase